MIRFATLLAGLVLTLPTTVPASASAPAGDVRINLSGVRAGGTLYVQLQTREQFMTEARAYGELVEAPAAGALAVTLEDVAPGDYAVSVWHDEDGNGRFDVDPATGKPLDGIAMIGADTLRGAPVFDQARMSVGVEGANLALPLRYGR
jgi:uncharacterized protein (DUF2141 family)